MTLDDDLFTDGGIQRAMHVAEEQGAGIAVAQSTDEQLGESGEDVVARRCAGGAHNYDPLGEQATADEGENLGGGLVEPLRVVDDANER